MPNILYPAQRLRQGDTLFVCEGCGAAEWAVRRPLHHCPASRDGFGKRNVAAMRAATKAETAAGARALSVAA